MPGKQANLFAFADAAELASALRQYVVACQDAGIARHGVFKVALSGGSLAKTLAQALLAPTTGDRDRVRWDKWEIFFADERAVPLDDDESNYKLVKAELLDKIPATPAAVGDGGSGAAPGPVVHTVDASLLGDVQELADAYEKVLVTSFANRDSVRLPIFDLLLLGCGQDGHTCSLFPDHALLLERDAWVAPIEDSPKPPQRRITLTLPVVTHAVHIAFVATGAGKQSIMRDIFEAGNKRLPCVLVNQETGSRCSWFVDEAAVQGVSCPKGPFSL